MKTEQDVPFYRGNYLGLQETYLLLSSKTIHPLIPSSLYSVFACRIHVLTLGLKSLYEKD